MHSTISLFFRMMAIFSVLTLMAACAVTTGSTEGSSETFVNTSEASTKLTSSTSPRGDSSALIPTDEALKFTKANHGRIKTDIAAGGGEHLRALSTLLGVPVIQQQAFFSITKENFTDLYSSDETTSEELLEKLRVEVSSNHLL